jgi:integrase
LTERWEREGWRPVVGVWTAKQTALFLAQVHGHRLYALFHLVALRGLRRGEAAGLRWSDLDLDAGTLTVTGQLQQLGGRLIAGPPKTDAGSRVIALDKTTIAACAPTACDSKPSDQPPERDGPTPGTCSQQ